MNQVLKAQWINTVRVYSDFHANMIKRQGDIERIAWKLIKDLGNPQKTSNSPYFSQGSITEIKSENVICLRLQRAFYPCIPSNFILVNGMLAHHRQLQDIF